MTEILETVSPRDETGNDPNDHRSDSGYVRRILGSASPVPGSTEKSGAANPAFRLVRTALSEPIPPIRYVVDHILPRQNVTLLGGHGGSGKSLLALVLAAHCAAGKDWCGLSVIQSKILFLSLEDPADLIRLRLRRIVAKYALSAEAIETGITIADGSDGVTLAHEAAILGTRRLVFTPAFDELRELATGHDLVVIDNASDAFSANENDRRIVRSFMSALARISREQDAAVLLLAHIDKNAAKFGAAGNSYSGSTAWHNSARSRLALIDGELRHEKANLCRAIEPIALTWTDDGVLVPGRSIRNDLLDPMDDNAVLAAIQAAIVDGTCIPVARTGPSTTQHVLCTHPELPDDLRDASGRPRFWGAITRLQRAGKITQEVITTPSRHKKTCWICAGSSAYSMTGNEKS